jgi:hypothetical protein
MTVPAQRDEGTAVIGGRGVASVGVASAVAAASGYLVLVIVARYVEPSVNADFLVYWSLLFGGFGILGGLQQEATRSVGSVELGGTTGARRTRILPWSLTLAAAGAAVAACLAPWWRPQLLDGQPVLPVAVLCVAGVAFAGHVTLVGALAGRRQWTTSSFLIGAESALRVVLTVLAVVVGADLVGLEVAVSASAVLWVVMLPLSRRLRAATGAQADSGPGRMVARQVQAMLAAAGAAALVVGYPTLLRATTPDAQWATAAPLVLAISLTRAPLLMPLNAFQGVAISYFLDPRRKRGAALVRILAVVVAVGVVGATAAFAVGPWLMATLFGESYRVDGPLLLGLTLASTALAVVTLTGSAALALGRHLAYAGGWFLATAVSAAVLLTDLPLATRAVMSLAVGPVAGACVHLLAVRSASRATPPPAAPAGPPSSLGEPGD